MQSGSHKRREFVGIAIAGRRAGEHIRYRGMQVDFDEAGGQPAKQCGEPGPRHRA
jgi:hypothetical protein